MMLLWVKRKGPLLAAGRAHSQLDYTASHYIRGLAGTVLVYKIAGALAQRGGSLDDVYNIAQWVSSNIATVGVGLEHCHVSGFVCFCRSRS